VQVSALAEMATKVIPRTTGAVQEALPFVTAADDLGRTLAGTIDGEASALQSVLEMPRSARPRLVIVGIGSTAPKTTQSLVHEAARRGMVPGEDVVVTNYRSLRVGRDRGFVRLAQGAGDGGRVLAGQGEQALFLFRGGGNLSPAHMRKIGMIQAVDGATALSRLDYIERAGSKAITYDMLHDAGLALAETVPVKGEAAAVAAFEQVQGKFGADTVVLKKVNSLGGKDVHFVRSTDDVRAVIAAEPDAEYVMQEFLPYAKDQDVRIHMVYNGAKQDFEVADAYVRNRKVGGLTPNLANDGFATPYTVSPWEENQALEAARVLSRGSERPPLHVGLDLFPRRPILPSVVEGNDALRAKVAAGEVSLDDAIAATADTAVIGEAASSAGTKGTEIVRDGRNPVVEQMMDEIDRLRGA
jgi:hypothetical protein